MSGGRSETLGDQKADRELILVTRGTHRDGDLDRRLIGSGRHDLERLLARQGVCAPCRAPAVDRDDVEPEVRAT